MSQVKYTKMELRSQQVRLGQLEKYLPTLQLKKAMLQSEISIVSIAIKELMVTFGDCEQRIEGFSLLLSDKGAKDLHTACEIVETKIQYENIAGLEIPNFDQIIFQQADYFFFDTPIWLESAIGSIRHFVTIRENLFFLREKKRLLEEEIRQVSIRVNLFEKRMIPQTKEQIKKIKIFLGDQELSAVSQAKASKKKILQRRA